MIRWTGLAPWEFEFPFPGSLTSTFLCSGLDDLLLRGEEAFGVLFLVAQARDRAFDCRQVHLCSGSEEGSYFRLIDFCITQL